MPGGVAALQPGVVKSAVTTPLQQVCAKAFVFLMMTSAYHPHVSKAERVQNDFHVKVLKMIPGTNGGQP